MNGKDNRSVDAGKLRSRAEESVREKAAQSLEDIRALSPEEMREKLHELQVHQIELEIQNEALRTAYAELDIARERYFDLYDLAPVGYCTISEQGQILETNFIVASLLGVAREALIKQPITRFICKEDQDIYYLHRKQLFETGEPQTCYLRMVKQDGASFWAHLQASMEQVSDGTPECRVVMIDITEHRRSVQQLAESQARLQTLVQTIPDMVWLKDPDGVYLDCNAPVERLYNAPKKDIIGKTDYDFVDRQFADFFRENDRKAVAFGKPRSNEEWITFADDGHQAMLETIKTPMLDDAGNLVGVLGIARDITERKRTEVELRRYQHIVSSTKDMLALIDNNYVYLSANAAYLQAFAKTSDEMIGRTMMDVFGEAFFSTVIRPRAERCLSGEDICFQDWYEYPAAGRKYMDVAYFPYLGMDEEIKGFIVSSRDITEQEKLKAQFIQAQKMEAVGRLAGGVAHDFNNMLAIILGYAELGMSKVDPAQPIHSDLEEIRNAANRSADLTRQLLAFARKQIISPVVLDLNETIEGMLKMLRRLIGEDIDLVWLPGKVLWQVMMDPSQIDQILANLCVNARDAICSVGKMTIETENRIFDADYCTAHLGFVPGEYVMLSVSDNGCGMDKETQLHIFEPFFTTKETGKGTGLGLATVYGIVKQNKGFINVYSEPEQGTTFSIYLPQHIGKSEQALKEDPSESAAHGSEIILLVEDEPKVLDMTRLMLEKIGYTVLAASTPGEAIRLAKVHTGHIHLVVTDVIMPSMNGRDLVRSLLTHRPYIKSLFMSGYTVNVITHHGVLEPGVNFIQKPFSLKNLAAKLRKVLEEIA